MATRVLYMEERRGQNPDPCYLREFDANVVDRGPDFVVLDQTAFYAEGGGQPDDTGLFQWAGGALRGLGVPEDEGVIPDPGRGMTAARPVRAVVERTAR